MKDKWAAAAVLLIVLPLFPTEGKVIVGVNCRESPPRVDGILDDPCWLDTRPVAHFIQVEPEEGNECSEPTEVRVAYSQDEMYVAIKAYDSSEGGPQRYMARRDSMLPCDWLTIWIDSLGDRRTAFQFAVNPSGVMRDVYWYDEEKRDSNWDPVWDVAVHVDKGFWTAEFRIPFSQLRFPVRESQEWGFQVERVINRKQEKSYWAPVPKGSPRFVSLFGKLILEEKLPASRSIQVLPYTMGRLSRTDAQTGDPFVKPSEWGGNLGLDVKYNVSSNFVIDATVNPDFGQVESDPSYVNLSAYEVYLPEKRPFFVEGVNVYNFSLSNDGNRGHGEGDSLFYSRRIGRSPRFYPEEAEYADIPSSTPIAMAVKLTGKTQAGWSLGILEALTPMVNADFACYSGLRERVPAEPLGNFTVARVQKDFRQGRSAVGAIFTSVLRDIPSADLDFISRRAFTGGIDFRHRWKSDTYEVAGAVMMSGIEGSAEAIQAAQESSARYFQRPDNNYVDYDPSRTSLSGHAFRLSLQKIDGAHWRWSLGVKGISPGFEINDLGYLREADSINFSAWLGYRDLKPNRSYREFEWGIRTWQIFNYAPRRVGNGVSLDTEMVLRNYWRIDARARRSQQMLSWATLRGGPSIYMPGSWNISTGIRTDYRKPFSLRLNGEWDRGDEKMSRLRLRLNLTARLRDNLSLEIGPYYTIEDNPLQYITQFSGSEDHFVFGSINQETLSLTIRFNYALTPALTLQLYAQPFISRGEYGSFKEVKDPKALLYADRWHIYSQEEIAPGDCGFEVNRSGDAFTVEDPDFLVRQFRMNLVLRWEYRPGSAVYLVWTQNRDADYEDGMFGVTDNLRRIFQSPSNNIFLIKFTYWFNI